MDEPFKIILQRLFEDRFGTHGEIKTIDGKHICFTIEQPWRNNHPYIAGETDKVSCIPEGEYECGPHNSIDHPSCWEILNVQGRTAVLIHTGNTEKDTKGCVIVGTFAVPTGVTMSKLAMAKLHEILPPHFVLEIFSEE